MTNLRRLRSSVRFGSFGNLKAYITKGAKFKLAAVRERKISPSGLHALELVPVHTSYQRIPLPWPSKPLQAISMFALSAQCHKPSFANPQSGSQISPGTRANSAGV